MKPRSICRFLAANLGGWMGCVGNRGLQRKEVCGGGGGRGTVPKRTPLFAAMSLSDKSCFALGELLCQVL